MKRLTWLVLGLSSVIANVAFAEPMPRCFDEKRQLDVMNEQVIQFKRTMPNLKKIQVLVKANFVKEMQPTFNNYGHHQHFIVSLRDDLNDSEALIEISHSMNGYTFPEASDLKKGPIYICAEYSTTRADGFPKITKFTPSATGAMLHWTHQASRSSIDMQGGGHPNGWIYANGKVFGRYNK